jgi:hypothetical protein
VTGRRADACGFGEIRVAEPSVILQQTQYLEVDAVQSASHGRIFHILAN